jgi:3-oxoacyl-[acyl-carrier protein] reductase
MTISKKPVAIVTGSSRGVGAEVAKKLSSKGWNVTITCSSSIESANQVAKECEALGAEVLVVKSDVSKDSDCNNVVKETASKWGRIDSLINNAGTTKFNAHHELDGLSAEDFLTLYSVNTVGPYLMIKEAQSLLLKSPIASVVNVASIAGVTGIGSSVAYAASKGALITMTKSLARALGPIRVNAICPGFIQGDWLRNGLGDDVYEMVKKATEDATPLSLCVTAEQVADSICYFAKDAVTTTGETLLLDGGAHLS